MGEELILDCETGEASVVEVADLPVVVPVGVTPRQARLELLEAGILDDVEAAIDGLGQAARIEWDNALEVRRDNALLAALQPILGLTDEQVDAMFVSAAER